MILEQWDIVMYPFDPPVGVHPAVIVSMQSRVGNPQQLILNALICTTARLNRPVHPNEVALDTADGLDWLTACKCDLMYVILRNEIQSRKGKVIPERRRQISRKIIELFSLTR
jgi:hypothetical protein